MGDGRGMLSVSGKAYKIFVDELLNHLDRAKEYFDEAKVPTDEELQRASGSFHTIKGGAGFFGLKEIAAQAGRLEELTREPGLDLVREVDAIRDLILELERLARDIPDPQ